MKKRLRDGLFFECMVCVFLAAALARPGIAKDNLQEILSRMDKAAGEFQAMTAQVTHVTHTDVLNEDSPPETGTVTMKKVQPGEVQGKIDFTSPDLKTVTIEKRRVQEYLPKINTLQIFDLDKRGPQLDKFLMIGFGTSGTEIAGAYDVTIVGSEQFSVQAVTQLQLIPKNGEAKQYVKKLVLWIPDQGDPYPLREKIFEPSGDYQLVTYSNLKINPPLQPGALQLKLPAGVKTEHPGK
jgi:outer membrane lipoprotein-sorting protein